MTIGCFVFAGGVGLAVQGIVTQDWSGVFLGAVLIGVGYALGGKKK